MRKLISLMHVSLDGFCAGPDGGMNWIGYNDAIFADAVSLIERAGAAVYGRTTHGMMRGYWPAMLNQPDSAEVRHARWVEDIPKHTFTRTMQSCDWNNSDLHRDAGEIFELKKQPGRDLLIFGSPRLVHGFLELDAIDEFWLFLNPILLGGGTPYFTGAVRTKLKLLDSKPFDIGVVRLHYAKGDAS
jgi:dihydrofolate reductase